MKMLRRAEPVGAGFAQGKAKGQALILAVISLLVLCLGVIVLFNTGQTVSKKVELVNTADAAAYSVGVEQARAFNLIAYMNRATVANQVAVAQMVSWYSWTNYMLRGTDNFKDAVQAIAVLFDVSVVGAEIGAGLQEVVSVLSEVKTAVQEIRDGMQVAFSAGVTAISALDAAYSDASQLIAIGEPQSSLLLARKIVALNTDNKATVGVRGMGLLETNAIAAAKYASRYTIPTAGRRTADADRLANVVMEARDGFSKKRNGDIGPIHKRGGTDLVNYRDWVGVDTLNAKFSIWPAKYDVGLSWGGAAALARTPATFRSVASPGINNGRGWDSAYEIDRGHYSRYAGGLDNNDASGDVLSSPAMGGTSKTWLKSYSGTSPGLQDYNDVPAGKSIVPYDPTGKAPIDQVGPVFTVLVEQPMNTVHTSENVQGIGGPPDFQTKDQAVADSMTAMSTAQVYFSRPRELFANVIDSRRELGSLFSPYWQVRLVDTPCAVRWEVAASYGGAAACAK
ncbi:pilus assembly protein TadG-related protein [Dyella jiangningensis]|uniref:pilus assembly protein TadG-related protein n=1 Tax=Dyella jiangningensis TaxID=1379159 RepID=UPI0024100456|nr:pilus assembly protein TadG-related protein [Dyella jiangningensis]MDG2536115.1 pilus assembly protein TadG-related protein [Dyella jiangningensis]